MVPYQHIAHAAAKRNNKQSMMPRCLPPPPTSPPQLPTYQLGPSLSNATIATITMAVATAIATNAATPTFPPPNNAPFSPSHVAKHKKGNLTLNNEGNIQFNLPWTYKIVATMNMNTADTDGDDFDEDDYKSLSPLLLTQNFVPSPKKVDSSTVAAAHLFPSSRLI